MKLPSVQITLTYLKLTISGCCKYHVNSTYHVSYLMAYITMSSAWLSVVMAKALTVSSHQK